MSVPSPETLLRLAGVWYYVVSFAARLPFAMMVVGLLTLVVSVRESFSLGGLNSAAAGVGMACFGPLLGLLADRLGQRPVLLAAGIGNGILLGLFAWVVYSPLPDGLLLATSFLIGATSPQVAPFSRSRLAAIVGQHIPSSLRPRTMNSMMAYESAADEIVFVIGPFVVGVLAAGIAPWAPLAAASALTLVFVSAFALHPTAVLERRGRSKGDAAPARQLVRPGILVLVVGVFGFGLFFGSTLTSLTAFLAERATPEDAGILYGVMSIGSAVFALGVALLPDSFSPRARLLVSVAIVLAGSALLPLVTSVPQMALILALTGIGIGPALVTHYGFAADRSPAGRSSTVMASLGSAIILGQALGAAVTGEVAQHFPSQVALFLPAAFATIVVGASLVNWPLSRPPSALVLRPDRMAPAK